MKETDIALKELYEAETETIKYQMQEINSELCDSFFQSANEGINNVIVEIRPGKRLSETSNQLAKLVPFHEF